MTRPDKAVLARDTDLSRTAKTRATIEAMVDGRKDHRIDDIDAFFAAGFRWIGNSGCGTKLGLAVGPDNCQRPFQAACSDKICTDAARLLMGEQAAAFGRREVTLTGPVMGIAATASGSNSAARISGTKTGGEITLRG